MCAESGPLLYSVGLIHFSEDEVRRHRMSCQIGSIRTFMEPTYV
jgi:hypothetical protein